MTQTTALPKRPSLWKVPLVVFLLAMGVVAIFADQQQRAAADRAEAAFAAEQATIEQSIASAISARIVEFNVAIDFISSGSRIDADQLQTFLANRRGDGPWPIEADPGLTVAEIVDDTAALEERERAAGRNFSIFAPLGSSGGERIVITHVERDIPTFGRSFVGFDVTAFAPMLTPVGMATQPDAVSAEVVGASELLGALQAFGASTPSETGLEDAVIYLFANIETADGSTRGRVTRLEAVSEILSGVEAMVPEHYGFSVAFRDGEPLALVDNLDGREATRSVALDPSSVSRDNILNLDPLSMRLTASAGIEESGVGFANVRLWVIGLAGALAIALFALMRAHQARRLADTGEELAIAQTQASTDSLTGLLNRQGLAEVIEEPMRRPGALLFIDIDNFKSVNDEDGHAVGDRVLSQIGTSLTGLVRPQDAVCRLGGDEFLLFLPGLIETHRLDDLRERIAATVTSIDPRISCSTGVATRSIGDTATIDDLLRSSDAAMYDEKRSKASRRTRATSGGSKLVGIEGGLETAGPVSR